jgi:hypothetical protein
MLCPSLVLALLKAMLASPASQLSSTFSLNDRSFSPKMQQERISARYCAQRAGASSPLADLQMQPARRGYKAQE